VTGVTESDVEVGECRTFPSPPDSLPVIRQSGESSSAVDDVIAYVDAAAMATTPVASGDVVVDMSEDAVQVAVSGSVCDFLLCHKTL